MAEEKITEYNEKGIKRFLDFFARYEKFLIENPNEEPDFSKLSNETPDQEEFTNIIEWIPPVEKAEDRSALSDEKHKQRDFFVADILDFAPKDDTASMEHPIFALKAGDMRERVYERNGSTIKVQPGLNGCATIHDKDLLIYCISHIVEAMNRGRVTSKTVRFTAYDFLTSTNRDTSGRAYERMGDSLNRLAGTRLETNIITPGYRERGGFGLIDTWYVVERAKDDDRMVAVEVELSEWLWCSIKSMQVLTLNRDYFRIRKPLDRRIYEIARKHCGNQPKWSASIKTLYEKSGSTRPIRNFRGDIKALAKSNELPDYRMVFEEEADAVVFYARAPKGRSEETKAILSNYKKLPNPSKPRG